MIVAVLRANCVMALGVWMRRPETSFATARVLEGFTDEADPPTTSHLHAATDDGVTCRAFGGPSPIVGYSLASIIQYHL